MITVFLDVETTGLEPSTCSIIQLSGLIRDGEKEETFDFRIKPYRDEIITNNASLKTGLTQGDIIQYPDQKVVYMQFIELLQRFKVGSSYSNKAYFIGYNSGDFDCIFIRSWFEFNNNKRYGYFFWWPDIDVARLAALYYMGRRQNLKSFKLLDVYEYTFGKPFNNPHNALSDVLATKELFEFFTKKFLFDPLIIENDGEDPKQGKLDL